MTPITLIRVMRATSGLLLVASALLVALGVLGPEPSCLLLGAAGVAGAALSLSVLALTERRLRCLALRHDCRLCPRCLQPILHRTDRCPECGGPVDMSEVYAAWRGFALRGETGRVNALGRSR